MVKQIFVNLPIKNLERTKKFFTALGFTFNPQFTDEKAACLVLSEQIFAMLITEQYFTTFLRNKTIADATKSTEVLTAISVESKAAVDTMVEIALAQGGAPNRDTDDYGWMYSRSFQDPDGHVWEVLYIDEAELQKQNATKSEQEQ